VEHPAERLPEHDGDVEGIADEEPADEPQILEHAEGECGPRLGAAVEDVEPLADHEQRERLGPDQGLRHPAAVRTNEPAQGRRDDGRTMNAIRVSRMRVSRGSFCEIGRRCISSPSAGSMIMVDRDQALAHEVVPQGSCTAANGGG